MITTINLRNLRNAEFIQFLKNIISICQSKHQVMLQIEQVIIELQDYVKLLERDFQRNRSSEITQSIQELDATRDQCFIGIRNLITAYSYHFDPSLKNAASELLQILNSYGKGLTRLNYQAQTKTLSHLIIDLEAQQEHLGILAFTQIHPWLQQLKSLNEAFGNQYLNRTREYASLPKKTFKQLRLEAKSTYQILITLIKAQFTINASSTEYLNLIKEIDALIIQYKLVMEKRVFEGE